MAEEKILKKNVLEVIEKESLLKKLESGKSLRIKLGADPTRPDLHLGHTITLRKLKEFQDLGHKIIFLIGDFTCKIGDPSGRDTTRPMLSDEEIEKNAQTYLDQVGKILDVEKCEVRRNSEWYSKMGFAEVLKFVSKITVAQVIEREDFKERLRGGSDLALQEVIYPVMQGYDSVMLKADVEIGGSDQKLNMLMGRDLQKKFNQAPQDVVTMPLLVGTDGVKKMSKSLDNYIGISDSPENQFGKTMSIPDRSIEDYLDLATNFEENKIEELKEKLRSGQNPRDIKEIIAGRIVELYCGLPEVKRAKEHFDRVFRKKELPENIKEVRVEGDEKGIIELLVETGLAQSNSRARQLIEQDGVRINGEVVSDIYKKVDLSGEKILQVGKFKFAKVKIK